MTLRVNPLRANLHLYSAAQRTMRALHGVTQAGRQRARSEAHIYTELIPTGAVCFDVGAHLGARTAAFRKRGATVIAFEPQDALARRLRRVWRNDPKVQVLQVGLAGHEGRAAFAVCPQNSTLSTMSSHWSEGRFTSYKWDQPVEVPVTTLDWCIGEFGVPAFCKVDVEGYELNVLRGLSRPVPALSFEFTREFLQDAASCLEHLESLSPIVVNYSVAETMRWEFDRWVSPRELLDELLERSASCSDLWGDIYVRTGAT